MPTLANRHSAAVRSAVERSRVNAPWPVLSPTPVMCQAMLGSGFVIEDLRVGGFTLPYVIFTMSRMVYVCVYIYIFMCIIMLQIQYI